MTIPVLPRSLAPLEAESLPGYLLRLAHRLDLPPARVAALTGLAPTKSATIRASHLLALQPPTTATFAEATRLSIQETRSLTLAAVSSRYPPVDVEFSGRVRLIHGVFVKENWVLSRSTRYCPDCLAGDGSTIQQCHGGAWNKLWRLPVVFACPTHGRLLEHACPACGVPAHHRTIKGSQMLPLPTLAGLHPAACRQPHASSSACAHRLDTPVTGGPVLPDPHHRHALRLQQRLLALLDPTGPATTTSVGQPTTPARFFVDLRILACLITSSWPAASSLAAHPGQADLIDEHVRNLSRDIDTVRRSGQAPREIAFYDRPPLHAAACASLLTLAEAITAADGPEQVRNVVRPLVNRTQAMRVWLRQFLAGDGYCSPGLQTAVGLEIGAQHILKRAGLPAPLPLPRPVGFGVNHVPQHPPPEWIDAHFTEFTDLVKPHLLGRAVAVRLAQICVGGPPRPAGKQLGLPAEASHYAVRAVHHQLATPARRAAFTTAIDKLSAYLNTATDRIDYGARRQALAIWSIPADEWADLIAGITTDPSVNRRDSHTHWGNGKRLLASTWVWVHITDGEHIYAPPIRDPHDVRPGGLLPRYVNTRWRFINAAIPGHYARLRERLDPYADALTQRIDQGNPPCVEAGRSAIITT
jgi:hypothetical protein